jgi:hypothetical protein
MDEQIRILVKNWIRVKEESTLAWHEWQTKLTLAQQAEQTLIQTMIQRGMIQKRIQLGERGTLVFQEQCEYGTFTHQFLRNVLKEYCREVELNKVGFNATTMYQYLCQKRPIKKEWHPIFKKNISKM